MNRNHHHDRATGAPEMSGGMMIVAESVLPRSKRKSQPQPSQVVIPVTEEGGVISGDTFSFRQKRRPSAGRRRTPREGSLAKADDKSDTSSQAPSEVADETDDAAIEQFLNEQSDFLGYTTLDKPYITPADKEILKTRVVEEMHR